MMKKFSRLIVLMSMLVVMLSINVLSAQDFIIENKTTSLFVVNGTTGDIILAPSFGLVGLGTTSPNEKLTVVGNVNITGNITFGNGKSRFSLYPNGTAFVFNFNLGNVTFNATNTTFTGGVIVEGGLGVGTTQPTSALHVVGDANITGRLDVGTLNVSGVTFGQGDVDIDNDLRVNGGANITGDLGVLGNVGVGTQAPSLALEVEGSVNISGGLNVTNGNVLLVTSGGLVGIGTASPTAALDIGGGSGTLADGANDILIAGDLEVDDDVRIDGGAITLSVDTAVTLDGGVDGINFDSDTLSIDAENNRVGIGTNSPITELDVDGSGRFTGTLNATNFNASDGTAGYPGYTFSSDSDTGMYLVASGGDRLGLTTGGVIGLEVDSTQDVIINNGNLGIGTSIPDNLLTILGNEITSNAILHINATDNFNDSVANVLTLDHVLGSTNSTSGTGVSILFRATDNHSQLENLANITAVLYNATNGTELSALTFSTREGDTGDGMYGHLIERFRIDGYGRVGINNTAPNETLAVSGSLSVVSSSGSQGLYQDSSGNVGVGTTTPNTKFETNGTSTFGGDVNLPKNDLNVGGGYADGGITLVGQGDDLGSGQFGKDILLDGDIVSVFDVEINQSFLPTKDKFSILGNLSQRFLDLFVINIKGGNESVHFLANVSIDGNLSIAGNLSVDSTTFYVDIDANEVGIGTSDPGAALDVGGGTGTLADGANDVLIAGDLEVDNNVRIDGSALTTSVATTWDLVDSQTSALNIESGLLNLDTSNSRVGIGNTGPQNTLEVVGAVTVAGSLNASTLNTTGQVLLATNSGNVGIGNTLPNNTLDVSGNANISGTLFAGALNITGVSFSGGDLDIAKGLRVTGGTNITGDLGVIGNVGIGTLVPDNKLTILVDELISSPVSALHINLSDSFNTSVINAITLDHVLKNPVNSTGGVGVSILFRATDNASQLEDIANITAVLYNATNGTEASALTFSTRGADTGDGASHLTERLRIDGSGNVGVGTSNPTEKLEVDGSLKVSGNVTGSSFGLNETSTAVILSATGSKRLILTSDPSLWS
jgi:hypothetical protein